MIWLAVNEEHPETHLERMILAMKKIFPPADDARRKTTKRRLPNIDILAKPLVEIIENLYV